LIDANTCRTVVFILRISFGSSSLDEYIARSGVDVEIVLVPFDDEGKREKVAH